MSTFPTRLRSGFVVVMVGVFAILPSLVAAKEAPAAQTIAVYDARAGEGPCGFLVERVIEGTVELVPSIDAAGNLVLAIEPVRLTGTLTNPDTGKSVDLRWVRTNGTVGFGQNGDTTTVSLLLDGHFFRGHDGGRTDLAMSMPSDLAEPVAFEPGQRASDPWSHVCGLLA